MARGNGSRVDILLGVAVATWIVLSLVAPAALLAGTVTDVCRSVAAELFLIAGVACLARWSLTGRQDALRAALAFGIMGAALPVLSIIVPWSLNDARADSVAPLARAALMLPVLGLLARRHADAAAGRRVPWRTVAIAIAVPVLTAALLALLLQHGGRTVISPLLAGEVEVLSTGAWAALAYHRWARAATRSDRSLAVALGFLALGEAARTLGVVGLTMAAGWGIALQLAAAGRVAWVAATDLHQAYRRQGDHADGLSVALAAARRTLVSVEQRQQEQLHDARSLVAGVLGASRLLSDETAGAGIPRATLQAMITAELDRLRGLLDTVSDAGHPYDVATAIAPVLLAHRVEGATIDADIDRVQAVGSPMALATVIDNLLHNARVHAPGAQVWIRVAASGATARILVDDEGPGIPPEEREGVMRRSVRGADATGEGQGLGLFNCRRLIDDQGGTLELTESPAGGLRAVVTVPAVGALVALPVAS